MCGGCTIVRVVLEGKACILIRAVFPALPGRRAELWTKEKPLYLCDSLQKKYMTLDGPGPRREGRVRGGGYSQAHTPATFLHTCATTSSATSSCVST